MTAESEYRSLLVRRDPYEKRGERNSSYTLPALFRDTGQGTTRNYDYEDLDEPYQSVGADGLMGLASQFLLTLVPQGQPLHRLEVNRWELANRLQRAAAQGLDVGDPDKAKAQLEENLATVTAEVAAYTDTIPMLRPRAFEHFQHLLCVGNHMLEVSEGDASNPVSVTGHNLHKYVVDRDKSDTVFKIVLREMLTRDSAPHRALGLMMEHQKESFMYTVLHLLDDGRWEVRQELNDNVIEGSRGFFTADQMPFIVGRFIAASDESYGRSMIEHKFGDLRTLEGLTQALVEGAAAAARLVPFLDPNSGVSMRRMNEHRSGEWISGRADAASFLTVGKQADFGFLLTMEERVRRRLERGFLMATSIQRDGERVTAEEIRLMSQQLQATFGGIYSSIAEDFQRPLIRRIINIMESRRMIPKLPSNIVRVSIVAGLGGLGRGRDIEDLTRGVGVAQQLFPGTPQMLDQREGVSRVLQAVGIDPRGFLKSQEEIAAAAQAAQQAALRDSVAPELVRQTGGLVRDTNSAPS